MKYKWKMEKKKQLDAFKPKQVNPNKVLKQWNCKEHWGKGLQSAFYEKLMHTKIENQYKILYTNQPIFLYNLSKVIQF